jgi:hypothetical protein
MHEGGIVMNNTKNGVFKKTLLSCFMMLCVLSLTSCNFLWSKLTFRTFAQAMRGNNMTIVERDMHGSKKSIPPEWKPLGITAWKVGGSKDADNSLSMQYLEFDSEENCVKFFNDQSSYFGKAAGAGGTRSGNAYCTSGSGFYYYICYVGKKLVIGTCQTKDIENIYTAIKKMPQVTKIDERGALK